MPVAVHLTFLPQPPSMRCAPGANGRNWPVSSCALHPSLQPSPHPFKLGSAGLMRHVDCFIIIIATVTSGWHPVLKLSAYLFAYTQVARGSVYDWHSRTSSGRPQIRAHSMSFMDFVPTISTDLLVYRGILCMASRAPAHAPAVGTVTFLRCPWQTAPWPWGCFSRRPLRFP